jgi:putative ABC transport system substrate-binding protein
MVDRDAPTGVDLSVAQRCRAIHRVGTSSDIVPAFEAAKAEAEAINILASPMFNASRQIILSKANTLRLPTIFQWPEAIKDGALVAYGPSQAQTFRLMGRLIGKVLLGTDPGTIPVEQPTSLQSI